MDLNSQDDTRLASSSSRAQQTRPERSLSDSPVPEAAVYRVSAYVGPGNCERRERFSSRVNAYDAAREFANDFDATVFPGRWEQPVGGRSVQSFGWTNAGQRIWVYAL